MNNIVLPPPTPQDIEATLTAIRNRGSAICVWSQHCGIEKRDLWWVTSISPDGERHPGIGADFTLDEAVADAWIGDFLPWGAFPDFSDEDYANVPRHVPEGWQFELHAAPWSSARLRMLAKIRRKSIARNRRNSLARK